MTPTVPLFCALALLAGAPGAAAATPGEAPAGQAPPSPLAGTWVLEAADTLRPDGTRVPGYGPSPQGRLMVDRNGDYVLEIYRADSLRFGSSDKAGGTPAEYQAAVMRVSAHFGHVTVDPGRGVLVFEIARSVYPNWEGVKQVRQYQLNQDRLSYQVPPSATGDGTIAISQWRRQAAP